MDKFFTKISKSNYNWIKEHDMSPGEIIDFLEEGAVFRNFSDVIKTVYPESDITSKLAAGLSEITEVEYSNVLRKIRNWTNGKNTPQNREQLFQIAFILGLDEAQANYLMASTAECGIHYRNPVEIIYAFALRTGKTYQEAVVLQDKLKPIYSEKMKETGGKRKKERSLPEEGKIYTRQIKDDFQNVYTEDELVDFFNSRGSDFGEMHETAYDKFIELLKHLQRPEPDAKLYSVEKIIEEYLNMHVPKTRGVSEFTYLQKVIKKNWPSESDIAKMKSREIDVSRKVLLLLFIITEDFEFNAEADDATDEKEWDIYSEELIEESAIDRLEIRLNKINLFLDRYGMNLLDPGNPFDCLVLYALRTQYGDIPISDNIESALEYLFKDYEDNKDKNDTDE